MTDFIQLWLNHMSASPSCKWHHVSTSNGHGGIACPCGWMEPYSANWKLDVAADILEMAERSNKERTGYGSTTVRNIIQHLRAGRLEDAQSEWGHDGDKITQHPNLWLVVVQVLGCRLHYQQDCQHWLCSKLREAHG